VEPPVEAAPETPPDPTPDEAPTVAPLTGPWLLAASGPPVLGAAAAHGLAGPAAYARLGDGCSSSPGPRPARSVTSPSWPPSTWPVASPEATPQPRARTAVGPRPVEEPTVRDLAWRARSSRPAPSPTDAAAWPEVGRATP